MKTKTMFDAWSTDALRGYVVMLGEFMSGSMQEDSLREGYCNRLELAKAELRSRDADDQGKRSIAFPAETVSHDEPSDPS